MRSTLLRDPEAIQEFFNNFGTLCSNPIDLEYFQKADRIRAFYKNGRMLGGYVVNAQGPLRYERMIPEPERSRAEIAAYFADGQACEITCFWMVRARLTTQERNNVYFLSAWDALSLGKRWIFGGSVSVKLARTQKRVMPRVVYEGPWDFEGSPADAQIYCANWWQLSALIIAAFSYTSVTDFFKGSARGLRRAVRRQGLPLPVLARR